MPVERFSVSLPPGLADAMRRRNSALSSAVTSALVRYLHILATARNNLPELTADEKALILDACNGTLFADAISVRLLPAQIADAIDIDHLDRKWHVDGDALNAKLMATTYVERLALVDAVQIWWNRTATEDAVPYDQLLELPDPDIY